MRLFTIYALTMFALIILWAGTGEAITVTASPNPAQVGSNVAITIRSDFLTTASSLCRLNVNYGDGSPLTGVPPGSCTGFSCTNTLNHSYSAPGVYAVTVTPNSLVLCPLSPPTTGTSDITIEGFSIQRMELFFTNNKRGETTVQRNEAGLRAAASILYSGSGLLQGRWEIDGRVIGRVFQHLTFGGTLTLEMPAGITLPTFDPGSHTVQFIIENPAVAFQMPVLVYYVTPDEAAGPIILMLPKADDVIPYGPARFEWEGSSAASIYLVRFLKKPENAQIFSAYTAYPYYPLQETALRLYFASGGSYLWEVLALDDKGNPVAASRQAGFAFRGP